MRRTQPRATATTAAVETACPLDCPDSCSLTVRVNEGRVISIDGSHANPVTGGYICAKVRRFPERMYGASRVRYPMIRTGPRSSPSFARVSWDEALQIIVDRIRSVTATWGAEAILPFCYGGSNGFVTHDGLDATFFRRLGASRLARTVCAAPTGAANQALYGKMPSVTYQDYPAASLIVVWGFNPSVSGIHTVPYLRAARERGARIVVVDPRSTPTARSADLHIPVRPGTDLVVALAVHRHLFEEGKADWEFLRAHTTGAERLRERAAEWTFERASEVSGVHAATLRRFAEWYADASPALVRCGWGVERNRNGGSAVCAILALPAVAGKFGVRGGGYSMSNSASWGIQRTWIGANEPSTRLINMNQLGRALDPDTTPPVKLLFVYNSNPAATIPDQQRVLEGLQREDLFTVVFDQVFTDTAHYADVVLPATTFLEGYDVVRGYGPLSLQLASPVVDPVGEARSNADVFGELASRLGLLGKDDPHGELELTMKILEDLPAELGEGLREHRRADPPWNGAPVQFVDVFPRTNDGKVHLFPEHLDAEHPAGLYRYLPDPASPEYPLSLISPATERTISSTLGELPRPEVRLLMHSQDASDRGLQDGDDVRIFNALGEVRCRVHVGDWVRPGTVVLPKGLWRSATANGNTGTTLVPDTLTDIAGGACFNDARVQVERVDVSR
ncbi:MAG TPA: molybdopterin-dependent oxidoreductase [Vicinamibacterales bacterium]|nr:molybdopterin-dependent oxidoreductase [Vicinamibacterales bacterium]